LCVPDKILVRLFLDFKEAFGDKYQSLITKNSYRKNPKIQQIINDIIQDYQFTVLQDIDSQKFIKLKHVYVGNSNRLIVTEVS